MGGEVCQVGRGGGGWTGWQLVGGVAGRPDATSLDRTRLGQDSAAQKPRDLGKLIPSSVCKSQRRRGSNTASPGRGRKAEVVSPVLRARRTVQFVSQFRPKTVKARAKRSGEAGSGRREGDQR